VCVCVCVLLGFVGCLQVEPWSEQIDLGVSGELRQDPSDPCLPATRGRLDDFLRSHGFHWSTLIHIIAHQFIYCHSFASSSLHFTLSLLHSDLSCPSFQMKASLGCSLKAEHLAYGDLRYPLTEKLVDVFGGYKNADSSRRVKSQKSHDRVPGKRAEIVSEQLCGRSLSLPTIVHPAISDPVFRRYNRLSSA
jgi:hypothetical protein